MDGRDPAELPTPAWRSSYTRISIATYYTEKWREQQPIGSEVDEEFMKRLRGLGYVE
jgi:hypothetical protein